LIVSTYEISWWCEEYKLLTSQLINQNPDVWREKKRKDYNLHLLHKTIEKKRTNRQLTMYDAIDIQYIEPTICISSCNIGNYIYAFMYLWFYWSLPLLRSKLYTQSNWAIIPSILTYQKIQIIIPHHTHHCSNALNLLKVFNKIENDLDLHWMVKMK